MKKLFIFAMLIAVTLSCIAGKLSDIDIITLPETIKTDAVPLKAELVQFNEPHIYAYCYYVHNDSILLISNKSNNDEKAVKVYKYPSMEFVADFIPFGRGPGEVVSAGFWVENDNLIVRDANVRRHFILPIDSLLNSNYKPSYNSHGAFFVKFAEYSADSLVVVNPYCFSDEKSGIVNDAERLAVVSKNNKLNDEEIFGKNKYLTFSVSGGEMSANKDKNRIVFAHRRIPEMELYDYNLNLVKVVKMPDVLEYKYKVSPYDGIIEGEGGMAFTNIISDDEYFYTSYIGSYFDPDKLQNDYDSWIFKFDWDGNFIESYRYDKFIWSFTVSEEDDTFYATTFDKDDLRILVKLTKE